MKLIIFLLLILPSTNALIINEVHYNPQGNDNNQEFIEIISNETINLTNYIIQDLKSQDTLTPLKELNSTLALIVEEDFNHSNLNISIYSAGATIGNNLNNDNDVIILKDQNETLIDAISYLGKEEGKSFCKIPDSSYNLIECDPTPGNLNQEKTETPKEIELEITEFLPNPEGYDNAEMPEGEFIELFNPTEEIINPQGFYLKDLANHKLTIDNTRTNNLEISPKEYQTIYTNGFSGFLNNEDLEVITLFTPEEKELDQVSYSSSQEGLSWSKIDNKWRITFPTPSKENEKLKKEQLSSKITIEKIYDYDNKTSFGQQVNLKTTIYKGNTSKYSIKAYILNGEEKITKTSKLNLYTKFTNYTTTIPIQLEPNCKEKIPSGYYTLKVEGLDTENTKQIKIEGITSDLCEEIEVQKTVTKIKTKSSKNEDSDFETVINPSTIPLNIYESKTQDSKKLGIYALAAILTIIVLTKTIYHENRRKSID
tara:strand:+ start:210 stop:1661 length:1452 start_codon:yes stop_codon:yes gene_type:complete